MYPFDKHNRMRQDLCAYIDGELSPDAIRKLEAHLESCAQCTQTLEELRATSTQLSAITPIEAPRSFALTHEMVGDTARQPERRPGAAYATGLRYAAAGLAVALAVVIFVDGADLGSDNSSTSTQDSALQELDSPATTDIGATAESVTADQTADAGGDDDSQFRSGEGQSAQGAVPQATSAPAPAGSPEEDAIAPSSNAVGGADDGAADAESTQPAEDSSAPEQADSANDSDTLWTVAEILLAALLAGTLIAIGWTWFSRRRTQI
jgi:hypothetical protein